MTDWLRSKLRTLGLIAGVFVGFGILVELLGYITWYLAPTNRDALEAAAELNRALTGLVRQQPELRTQAPAQLDVEPSPKVHRVTEWPVERERAFIEAPSFETLSESGHLPPVEERLPIDPLVVVPPDQMGPYGGTWRRCGTGPQDVGIFHHRFAYDGLVRWDPLVREVIPNLAVSWEVTDGGRTFTFQLRRGVRWSDGSLFTAHDILFWYDDVVQNTDLTPVVPVEYRVGGEMMKLDLLDDYRIRFRFAAPNGLFLMRLASGRGYEMAEYPAHYLKQYHPRHKPLELLEAAARERGFDNWNKLFEDVRNYRTIGMPRLWPWVMSQPPPARPVVFERNPYYWKVDPEGRQLPYINRVTFEIYDPETINLKAINGELGMQSRHIQFNNYPLFKENQERGGYRVFEWTSGQGGTNVILPNHNHRDPAMRELIADRRFRIALSHAINRQEINEVGFFGMGEPRQMSPPPTSPYYSSDYAYAYTTYDPNESKRLLDEMGLTKRDLSGTRLLPDGRPLKLDVEVTAIAGRTSIIEMVAQNWRAIGIDAQVKEMARQLWVFRKRGAMHDVGVWGGSDEHLPILEPRWFVPIDLVAYHAPKYGIWYSSRGRQGDEPPPAMRKAMGLLRKIEETVDEKEHLRLFEGIVDLNRHHLWVIGLVGDIPTIGVVKKSFRNVPEVAVAGWSPRFPGNTAVECYAIDERFN
jgi:peptide/nickel transport system substrate-binding protein